MGHAREVLDRVTTAVANHDLGAVRALYAPDAVAETPDQGTIRGRDAIVGYLGTFAAAFPDGAFEVVHAYEAADTAIDEGYFAGTNTGPLAAPTGDSIPPTGRRVRVRECDAATVKDGVITSHRFFYDQLEFLAQLGLAPEPR
jgi:ketosteroid isomerase-like protein